MQSTLRALFHFLLLTAIGLGIYFRLLDLGKWSLAADEYYLTQSVLNLLDNGFPIFDCGGYYLRGLLQQYLTALVLPFSNDVEWGVRIVPVIVNLLAVPAVYILGKRLGGYAVACIAAGLFCLSLWEIEYARFARMYAPFQTLFLWQLVLLLKTVEDNNKAALTGMYIIAAIGLLVYEAAIFLTVLCALPLLIKEQLQTIKHIFITAALVVLNAAYLAIDFRHLQAVPHLPPDIVLETGQQGSRIPIGLPDVLLVHTLSQNGYWLYAAVLLFVVSVYVLWKLIKTQTPGFNLLETLAWIFIFLCSFLNLYGLLIMTAAFCLLLGLIRFSDIKSKKSVQTAIGLLVINGVFWLIYGLATEDWTRSFAGEEFNKHYKLLVVLLKYPDIYTPFIHQWLSAMPWLTTLIFSILGLGFIHAILRPDSTTVFSILMAAVIVIILLVGIMEVTYYTPRYTFFAYPLILILFCSALFNLSGLLVKKHSIQLAVYSFLIMFFMVASEDFAIYHLKNLTSAEINFRAVYSSKQAEVYYDRDDNQTPADYIDGHRNKDDLVISTLTVVPFYLDHLDYRFIDHRLTEFPAQTACRGTKAIWSNSDLIYRESDLFKIIDSSSTPVWVVMSADESFGLNQHVEQSYGIEVAYRNLDETIVVYKIDKKS